MHTSLTGNGATDRVFKVRKEDVVGLGSFTKTLPHNDFAKADVEALKEPVDAARGNDGVFADVPIGTGNSTLLINPQKGLIAVLFIIL